MADWAIYGCGYVGKRLALRLLRDGHRVRAMTRRVEKLAELVSLGAEVRAFDASKVRTYGPALFGLTSPNVVFSIPPVQGLPAGEALRRATEAASAAAAHRFIYLGSTAVYGETPEGEIVDEDSPIALSDPEALPRIADETACDAASAAGLAVTLLRLAAIYGPGRGVRERLKKGNYTLVDDGRHYFSRVHVDDLVEIIFHSADKGPPRALWCVSDDRPSTQLEYAEWLCKRLGVPLPPSVPSLEPGKARRPVRNRKVSNAKLKAELEFTFRYPSFVEGEEAIEAEATAPSA